MLRYWQAYTSIKDTLLKQSVSRPISVAKPTTQIWLSVLAATVSSFVVAITCVLGVFYREQFDKRRGKVTIPITQADWIVQAAREVAADKDNTMKMRVAKWLPGKV